MSQATAVTEQDAALLDSFEHAPEMVEIMDQVRRVVRRDTTLLLSGETGTGKTRLARMIHEMSPRRDEPFVVVDCGALSANLIESEMFGHIRGAFTGAERDRHGKFAAVGEGTLFLDEINALPLGLQSKLLRAVDERVFEPLGMNKVLPLKARIIAAANTRLDEDVRAGRFRADLYHRLNVIAFDLPPLRDRPAAIPALVNRFLAEFSEKAGRELMSIAADALDLLSGYSWPGNVRELRNVVERAVILAPAAEIRVSDLPEAIRMHYVPRMDAAEATEEEGGSSEATLLFHARQRAEATRISEALEKHGHNRRRAAAELGISRMALYKKLHKYGMAARPDTAMSPAI